MGRPVAVVNQKLYKTRWFIGNSTQRRRARPPEATERTSIEVEKHEYRGDELWESLRVVGDPISQKTQYRQEALGSAITTPHGSSRSVEFLRCCTSGKVGAKYKSDRKKKQVPPGLASARNISSMADTYMYAILSYVYSSTGRASCARRDVERQSRSNK